MKACPECKLVYDEGKECTKCNTDLSDKFHGLVIILDPENSQISQLIKKTEEGRYAIKVR